MSSMKTLETRLTRRDRYVVWVHLERNVIANNGREQDQIEDVRQALKLEEIQEHVDAAGRVVDHKDFSPDDEQAIACELTKEELAFLLALLVRPMAASLSRFTLPLKRRLEAERDRKGLKAVDVG